MDMPQNSGKKSDKAATKFTKLTPRNLVRKQVENENFHVSEEDMKNLDTSIPASDYEQTEFEKEAENNYNKETLTSYDLLDE